jgi:transposase InsO family protein
MLDADASVLSYYTQLPQVEIPSVTKAGRPYVQRYTPDVLILRRDRPEIREIKPGSELLKLAKERPHWWTLVSDTEARFLPPEKYFSSMGLEFSVVNSSLLPHLLVSNTKLLLRIIYTLEAPSDDLRAACKAALTKHAWMSVAALQDELDLERADDILHLVAQGEIHADVRTQRLCSPETLLSLSPGVLVEAIDGRVLPNAPVPQGVEGPTLKEASKAVSNLQLAETGNCRQARRMRKKIKDGAALGLSPFESVLPRISKRGNRRRRLATSQEKFMLEHQEAELLTGNIEGINQAYYDYRPKASASHPAFRPVSLATYYAYANRLSRQKRETAIHGKKAGNAVAEAVDPALAAGAATRAFQRGLVDHTLAKILLVVAMNKKCAIVRRPWISSLVDEYSGATLAEWVSFGNPSRESVCMLLRMCILRHGRIPEEIHSDRGSDFTSLHVQALMAYLTVTRQYSPAAAPKFNSQAETRFAKTQIGLFRNLPGHIIEYENRKTERDRHPAIKSIFDPPSFYKLLFEFSEGYNNGLNGSHAAQPNYLLAQSLGAIECSGVRVTLNDDVYLATCVPVESRWGPRPRKSLYIDGRHYYSSCLTPGTKKKDLCIRLDPWNCNVIYIQKQGNWYTAMRRGGQTVFSGTDFSRQLGESLRVLMCRRDRDAIKAGQREDAAQLIGDAIARAKNTRMATCVTESSGDSSAERKELERQFSKLEKREVRQLQVEWD